MKKAIFVIVSVTVLAVCLFAGCNGAEGGKITDNMQNLSEAMTGMQEMMTDVSDAFTNAPDNTHATNITNITNVTGNANNTNGSNTLTVTDNITM